MPTTEEEPTAGGTPVPPGVDVAVETRDAGTVHVVTVRNERRLNVLDSGLLCQLGHALATGAADPRARAIVLRGAGERAWIGGADITEMATLELDTARGFITLLHEVCRRIREHPLPVVAAIRGWCLGAGLEIAACCDLRLAAVDARFAMPEVRVGIPSVIEAAILPRLVGAGRARDLVMTGRTIDAGTAERWGLVELAGEAGLDALVEARVGDLLAGAPGALGAQKRLCASWDDLPLDAAVEAGIDAFGAAFETDEPALYMRRFIDRER